MTKTMTGIECAMAESRGEGVLVSRGRKVSFRRNDGMVFDFYAKTDKQAVMQIDVLRKAPKYFAA